MNQIITRAQARHNGLGKYFTGVPCRNGHIAERYTQSGSCEDCIRQSRAIVISKPTAIIPAIEGEIITPSPIVRSERMEIIRRKVQIEETKLTLRAQDLALKAQREQRATVERAERIERRERAAVVKSKLTEVNIATTPEDYVGNVLMIWGFAAQRDSRLKPEDMLVRQVDEYRFRFRCFPEDREEILRVTKDMWDRRQAATLIPEIEQKRLAAQAALQAMVDAEDNGEPEGDPTSCTFFP